MAGRRLKYYAIRGLGGKVQVKKTTAHLKRITERIKIPKLPGSPNYDPETGLPHKGTVLSQVTYIGGTTVADIAGSIFVGETGLYVRPTTCIEVKGVYKTRMLKLLENLNG